MKRRPLESPLFFKYLVSYLLVLLLPILITGFFVYRHFVGILQAEVSENNGKLLQQIKNTVDIKISEMTKISAQISFQPELSPYRLQKDFYNVYAANGFLDYTAANQFLDQVLLYYKGGDYLYSSESTYTLPRFLEIRGLRDWPPEQFRKELDGLKQAAFHFGTPGSLAQSEGNMITYMVPIPVNSPEPIGAVLFMFKDEAIVQSLQGIMEQQGGNSVIVNREGNIITVVKASDYLHTAAFQAFVRNLRKEGSYSLTIDGVPYMISCVKSSITGWTYMTVNPLNEMMSTVNEVKNRAGVALLLILLLGGAAIYMQMRWNYNPIRRLFRYAESNLEKPVRSWLDVQSGFAEMAESRSQLKERLQDNSSAVRQYLLTGLLKGKIELAEFNDKGREVGVSLSGSMYAVMLIALGKRDDTGLRENLSERIPGFLPYHFPHDEVLLQEDSTDCQWICLISTDREANELEASIADLQESLSELCRTHVTIGAGTFYSEPENIGKSYIEAVTALDYKLIKGENKVLFFDELEPDTSFPGWYPKQEMESLGLLIQQGDADSINLIVTGILERIESIGPSLHLARCICFDMINTVIKSTYAGKRASEVYDYPDVVRLTEFTSIHELAKVVSDVCCKLCRDIREDELKGREKLIRVMIEYVEEHGHHPSFSITSLAEHLSLPLPKVSTIFKEQTGQTISEYVNYLRMERAKDLLRDSDLPLSELVVQVGYYDVSSFIRKFRQSVKMTPGEYRKSARA